MKENHGEAKVPQTVEYRSWAGMIQRCTNPKNPKYNYYGKLGIGVCQRWRESYLSFLEDMGRKPTINHTIDRIDSLLDYSPENCKWSTRAEQSRNRSSVKLTVEKVNEIRKLFSEGKTQKQLTEIFNLRFDIIYKVVRNKTWIDIN